MQESTFKKIDYSKLRKLINDLVVVGFRGSSQEAVDQHLEEYLKSQSNDLIVLFHPEGGKRNRRMSYCKVVQDDIVVYQGTHASSAAAAMAAMRSGAIDRTKPFTVSIETEGSIYEGIVSIIKKSNSQSGGKDASD